MSKERPILFNGEMVRAIQAGRKTETRRVIKLPDGYDEIGVWPDMPGVVSFGCHNHTEGLLQPQDADKYKICPHGKPGDRLWVQESFRVVTVTKHCREYSLACVRYKADDGVRNPVRIPASHMDMPTAKVSSKWHSGRFMPRWASRTSSEVDDVRVERVQDIDELGALAEGVPQGDDFPVDKMWCGACGGQGLIPALGPNLGVTEADCLYCDTPIKLFHNLWDSTNAKYGWDANPLVWVVKFHKVEVK
jgi:hypothetical protein